MTAATATDTIRTRIPARLDRLPWSRFHWLVVIGLGTVWILDGLEVTIVGSVARPARPRPGSGHRAQREPDRHARPPSTSRAPASGALFFGQLTDRFGRKKLFLITLCVYIAATVADRLRLLAAWYFFIARFFTGAGIGGEYAAINSAIDELIPARVRGRVDLIINGSYWVGAAIGCRRPRFSSSNESSSPATSAGGLRSGSAPSSASRSCSCAATCRRARAGSSSTGARRRPSGSSTRSRREVARGERAGAPRAEGRSITVRQRKTIPFREIARTAFSAYPRRTVLGLALFVGQAFLYNAVTFDLGTLLSTFFGVASGSVPFYIALFAIGNFLGPLTLGPALRHGRPQADDHRHVPGLGRASLAVLGVLSRRRHPHHVVVHGVR